MLQLQTKKRLRVLDFDIENRPLSYWYDGKATAEITAIAHCWSDDINSMEVQLLGVDDPVSILTRFVERYNEADIVTGHYIRQHDLPNINGGLLEYGLPLLSPKMTSDTSIDLKRKGDIPGSQEYLAELFGIPLPKVHMSQVTWREGNRLTKRGIEATKKRASGDVLQHIMMRNHMIKHDLLKASRIWKP